MKHFPGAKNILRMNRWNFDTVIENADIAEEINLVLQSQVQQISAKMNVKTVWY